MALTVNSWNCTKNRKNGEMWMNKGFQVEEFLVERWMNTYENDAVYNLAETDAKPFTLAELLALGDKDRHLADLLDLRISYNPTLGSDRLRALLAAQYANTGLDEILVTTGAIEANFLLANVLIQPGDTVVIQSPAYQALYSVAEARGAKVQHWTMHLDEGYRPNLERLAALLDDNTRAVILNVPHNPTGAVLSADELQTIIGWAEEKDFWVICDEVYHDMLLEPDVLPEKARSYSSRAISIGSFSKSFGLSGLRLGWIAAPQWVVERCWSWKDYTSISISPINDYLASFALQHREGIFQRNVPLALKNRQTLMKWFAAHDDVLDFVPPRAGLLTFPRFRELPMSTRDFCLEVYNKEKVLLLPGECFKHPGYLRIGYGNDSQVFSTGLGIVSKYIQKAYGQGR
jgi:aspartate/methionine/tyrosine aminotransferase